MERGKKKYLITVASPQMQMESTEHPGTDAGALRRERGALHVEIYYRDNFSGLTLANRGGSYEWGPITVFQAQVNRCAVIKTGQDPRLPAV
jgi:hypothetical protein